jgi:hypothetical protein
MRKSHLAASALLWGLAAFSMQPASAAPSAEWPCVQPRVPSLSVAAFWSGPPVDDATATAWRDKPEIAAVVTSVVSRRTPVEEAEKQIATFAGSHKGDKDSLTLVFAGAFSELNNLRTQIVNGIERFAKGQRALSEDLNKTRDELTSLAKLPEKTDQQRTRISDLQTKIQWDTRIHNERQSTLRYVCEVPVILEQRVFAIARAVQNEM